MAGEAIGRWVVDEDTIWWEFGTGEAMEPEQALRNHVDNQQFNAAYDAFVALLSERVVWEGPLGQVAAHFLGKPPREHGVSPAQHCRVVAADGAPQEGDER